MKIGISSNIALSALASIIAAAIVPTIGYAAPRNAPLEINISYSDKLNKEFEKNYGNREKAAIEASLRKELNDELGDNAARVEVTIINATPNRPTFEQMSERPGLSYQSFSIGGAQIEGKSFDAQGKLLHEVEYEYTSPSIYESRYNWTWQDAEYAFYRFARRIASN